MFQHALWGFKHPSTTIESRNHTSSTTVCPIQTSAHLTLTKCLSNIKPDRAHLSTQEAVHQMTVAIVQLDEKTKYLGESGECCNWCRCASTHLSGPKMHMVRSGGEANLRGRAT